MNQLSYQELLEHPISISLLPKGLEYDKKILSQLKKERQQVHSKIIFDYGDGCVRERYWNHNSGLKSFTYIQQGKKEKGDLRRWKPYQWQNLTYEIPICVEGEKAAVFGTSKRLPCFHLPFKSEEYWQIIDPLISGTCERFLYIYDNDDSGYRQAQKLQRYFLEKNICQVYIINAAYIFEDYLEVKGFDIADYIEQKPKIRPETLVELINKGIEKYWRPMVDELWEVYQQIEQKQINKSVSHSVRDSQTETTTTDDIEKKTRNKSVDLHPNNNTSFRKGKLNKIQKAYNAIKDLYGNGLRFNELTSEVELNGEYFDPEDFYLTLALDYSIDINKNPVIDLVLKVAKQNSYHPVKEYLSFCLGDNPNTTIDIKKLSAKFFGTSNELYDQYLYRHLLASVKRILEPSTKKDECLVLKGNQGIGKSDFFRTLYGAEFFDDSVDGTDKDNLLIAHQYWCLELAELEYITKRKETGELKNFLSKNVDTFRTPYDRLPKKKKRGFVFVGSVNEDCFLKDTTGNRRFWVIEPKHEINLSMVREMRDAIWAEAYRHVLAGEVIYLPKEYWSMQAEQSLDHITADPWEQDVLNYIHLLEKVKIPDILKKGLDLDASKRGKREESRVADILKAHNWIKKRTKHERFWIKPETPLNQGGDDKKDGTVTEPVISKPAPTITYDYMTTDDYLFYNKVGKSENNNINITNSSEKTQLKVSENYSHQLSPCHNPQNERGSGMTSKVTVEEGQVMEKRLRPNNSTSFRDLQENNIKSCHQEIEKGNIEYSSLLILSLLNNLEKVGFKTEESRLAWLSNTLGRNISNVNELTPKDVFLSLKDLRVLLNHKRVEPLNY